MSFPRANFFIIGGMRSPGKATLLNAPREFTWDPRQAYAMSGGNATPLGQPLIEAKFLIELWDPSDWPYWITFAKKFLSKEAIVLAGGKQTLGLGILHPVLNAPPINVTKVLPKLVSEMAQDEFGGWSCQVTFLEFRPPRDVPDRPLATIPDVVVPQPTAKDAADREMQARAAETQSLADYDAAHPFFP